MTKNKEQLVIVDTIETAGSISYWRISSDVTRSALVKAWTAAGLDEKLLPALPQDVVALGRAVNALADKRVLVRPLARRGAWGIVHETATEIEGQPLKLTHETAVHVFFRDGAPVVEQANGTWAQQQSYGLLVAAHYAQARQSLDHHDVSKWLLDLAYKLGAVSLRDSGGVYFIPRQGVAEWNKIADAVEAGLAGSIFRIPAMRTADAVAAITDAITAEAAAVAAGVDADMQKTGEEKLGTRALGTRVKTLETMREKLGTYEELIGRQLEIRARLDELAANVSAAVLSSMNEAMAEAAS